MSSNSNPVDLYDKPNEQGWARLGERPRPTGQLPLNGSTIVAGVGAGGLLLGGLLALAIFGGISKPPPPPADCEPAASYLAVITDQERAGQWETASQNAQTVLRKERLCAHDVPLLVEKVLTNGLRAVSDKPINAADVSAQRGAVERYRNLEALANEHHASLPKSPREVAGDAYKVGQFLLAKEALEEAVNRGHITLTDLTQTAFYHDTTFNLGWWYSRDPKAPVYQQGLQLLSLAHFVDTTYGLRRGVARDELRQLLDSESEWPGPAASPVLVK